MKKSSLTSAILAISAAWTMLGGGAISLLVADDAVQVTGNVTINNESSNANYLNKNIEITNTGSLTYSNYKPNQTQAVTITNNGTLTFNNWSEQILVTSQEGTLTFNGSGTFVKSGTGSLKLFSNNFEIKFAFDSGAKFNITQGAFYNGEWTRQDWRENKSDMTISAGARLDLWDGGYTDETYTNKTGVIIDALNGAGTITATAGSNSPGTFVIGIDNGDGHFSGNILGGGSVKTISIDKKGTGTQILSGNNTYTGTTTISAGTLQIGNGGNTGTLGTGTITIHPNATLAFNRQNGQTLRTLNGTGTIAVKSGAVSLTNAFEGTVNVAANSAVAVASKANLQTGTYNIADKGILAINVDDNNEGAWSKSEFLAMRSETTPLSDYSNVTWGTGAIAGLEVVSGNSVNASDMFGVATPLYKTGGGELLLDSNQYADTATPVSIMEGSLRFTNAGKFNGTTLVVHGAQTIFDLGAGNTRVLDQMVSGEGELVVKSGTLQVTADSPTITYTHESTSIQTKMDTSKVTIQDGARLYFANRIMPHNSRDITFQIDAGGVLEFNNQEDGSSHNTTNSITQGIFASGGNTTITGGGTLLKTGSGAIALLNSSSKNITIAMDIGGLIDIQEGTFINGGWIHQNWANNKASINIAEGATFNLWDGNHVTVDALTGNGDIQRGSTRTFTVGVGNHTQGVYNEAGTATFTGTFGNGEKNKDSGAGLSLKKVGTGTQIMAGRNNYDGTIVSAGVLQFNANSNLGTGILQVDSGATLALKNGLANTIQGAFSGNGTVQLTDASSLSSSQFTGFTGTVETVEGTSVRLSVADGAKQIFNGNISGSGSFTKTGAGTMRMNGSLTNTGGITYDGGKVVFSNEMALGKNFSVISNTTAEFSQAEPYTITLYPKSGNGRVRPGDAIAGTGQGTAYDMDGCINNLGRGIITTYSTVSYLAEVWIPNDITVDFAGKYDDTIGVFVRKINNDGTKENWETVLDFGTNCVNQLKQEYLLRAGHYLMDFRAVDEGGDAYAMPYITDASGKRLGLGIRYNDSTTSSQTNNYYALDIDASGHIAFGDGAIRTQNPAKVFTADQVAIAEGVTFTIDNPDVLADKMIISGNFTGAGTLNVTNSSGNEIPLTLHGRTEGNLTLGNNMTIHLSKDNTFDVAGSFTQIGGTRYLVDLSGITEDMGWFTSVTSISGLDEDTIFEFITTEAFSPVDLTFFNNTGLTDEQWKAMIDFSGASGMLNYIASVGANGELLLTVGDKASLPEPASWLMMLLAGGLLGFLKMRKMRVLSQKS